MKKQLPWAKKQDNHHRKVRIVRKRNKRPGLPPGTLVYTGPPRTDKVRISVLDFDENTVEESEPETPEDCYDFRDKSTISWINVDGLHDVKIIEKLGNHFGFHPLVMEDLLNTNQRPKIEDYGDYIFIVLRMIRYEKDELKDEQITLIVGDAFVISFQEDIGDVFDPIRDRIRKGRGRVRKMGADYLAYCLIDSLVDYYFTILEKFGDQMEQLEEDITVNPKASILKRIHELKRELMFLRKTLWPTREVLHNFQEIESKLVTKTTAIYLRDVYDHSIQIIDAIETYRDMLASMVDIYLSNMSHRMNEVMKVLTVIATIFIPLTFVVGVYGMNFDYMPELRWKYGYFMIWGVMIAASLIMMAYFKWKKWL
ncbi:magnesium/cobalt transporter CorA [Candidatus Woesearchaeota archaeon]|nr:magnesium/cobalt transporter CorA [Candidatus Woesearchaeota archaeon]